MMTNTIRSAAVISALSMMPFFILPGAWSSPLLVALGLVLGVWVVSPFAAAFFMAPDLSRNSWASGLLVLALIGAAVFGAWVYFEAFFAAEKRDAQDALLFVFVPLWQHVGIGPFIALALIFSGRHLSQKAAALPDP